MNAETLTKGLILFLALVAAVSWWIAGVRSVAGDTFLEGHCQLGPVCVSGYIGTHMENQKGFRVANARGDPSWWTSRYEGALQQAERTWATAVGPQVPSKAVDPAVEAAWVDLTYRNFYIDCIYQGDPRNICDDPQYPDLLAYVCRMNEALELTCGDASNIPREELSLYTLTYIDTENLSPDEDLDFMQGTFAHEFGHTLLLEDLYGLKDRDCLMFCSIQHPPKHLGPEDCEIGPNWFNDPGVDDPCDTITYEWGIRCVFWWWREQHGALPIPFVQDLDCHDLDRNGVVDLPNDILGTILLFQAESPGKEYQPEADTNRDGIVDLPNDILGTILDFGAQSGHCESVHYPHA